MRAGVCGRKIPLREEQSRSVREELPSGNSQVTPALAWSRGFGGEGGFGHSCRVEWFPPSLSCSRLWPPAYGSHNLLGKEAPVSQDQFSPQGGHLGKLGVLGANTHSSWGWVHGPEERHGRAKPAFICCSVCRAGCWVEDRVRSRREGSGQRKIQGVSVCKSCRSTQCFLETLRSLNKTLGIEWK